LVKREAKKPCFEVITEEVGVGAGTGGSGKFDLSAKISSGL